MRRRLPGREQDYRRYRTEHLRCRPLHQPIFAIEVLPRRRNPKSVDRSVGSHPWTCATTTSSPLPVLWPNCSGAPVTIEDENSTVLAYSGGEQAVDKARIGTILGPASTQPIPPITLPDAGVFDRLHRESDPIYDGPRRPCDHSAPGYRSSRERSPRRLGSGLHSPEHRRPHRNRYFDPRYLSWPRESPLERDRVDSTRRRQSQRVQALDRRWRTRIPRRRRLDG